MKTEKVGVNSHPSAWQLIAKMYKNVLTVASNSVSENFPQVLPLKFNSASFGGRATFNPHFSILYIPRHRCVYSVAFYILYLKTLFSNRRHFCES